MKARNLPLMTDCPTCQHRAFSDLCNLDESVFGEFKKIQRIVQYQPGQFVFYEGHPVLALYILCSGRVKLSRSTKTGHCRIAAIVDPGALIETHSFQEEAIHEVTCESLERSQVCVIDRERYLSLLEQHGHLAVNVIKLLSRKMRSFFDETDQLAFASAHQRLARLLLELVERYGEQDSDGIRISLFLRREELAQMAAMTVETAVRLLQALQATHLIKVKGRAITILDQDRLARAARNTGSYPSLS